MWAHGNAFLTPGVEDVVFCYLRFPVREDCAHAPLLARPHKMRKITVVGNEKMVVFDDMELERKVTIYEKGPVAASTDVRASGRRGLGRHLQPEDREVTSRCALSAATSLSSALAMGTLAVSPRTVLTVVRALEQLQASLVAAPA